MSEKVLNGVSIIYNYYGGSMRDAAVANGVLNDAVVDTILVNRKLRRVVRA